jgi:hypothetical protein
MEKNEEYSKCLFKLYKKSFTNTFSKESPYLCTILIQIWMTFSAIIPKNIVLNIISFARERFQDVNLEVKKVITDTKKPGFDAHVLNLSIINLIICTFVHYSDMVLDIINIKDLIQYASHIVAYKYHLTLYECKIYVLSLCSILRNKNLRTNIIDDIPKIISFCSNILKRIKKEEINPEENIITNNIKNKNFDEDINDKDNDNDELDQDQIKSNKIKNKKIKMIYNLEVIEKKSKSENIGNDIDNKIYSIKNFNYKEINNLIFYPNIQKENELNIFRNTLQLLKNENNEQFSLYINNLTKEDKNHLQEIFEN